MTDDLDELLRRSLAAEASRIEPADGLRAIRARTVRAPHRWRRPVLALAAAAAVVAALLAAPSLLPSLQPSQHAASPGGSSLPAPTAIPGAGVVDMPTSWPYSSRAEGFRDAPADQAAGTYGDLTKPDQVAVRFVRSYVLDDSITARSLGAYRAGLRMQVDFDGRPMTRVYLVRVRVGDDAPYVVVDAESDRIGIDTQPLPAGGRFTLHGTTVDSSVAEVRLRAAGSDAALDGVGTVTEVGSDWTVPVALAPAVRQVTAAAWGVDPDLSMAFAARPLG